MFLFTVINTVTDPTVTLYSQSSGFVPKFLGAVTLILLAIIVSPILGRVAKRIIHSAKIDDFAKDLGIMNALGHIGITWPISKIVSMAVRWFFYVVFLVAASNVLGWTQVTEFLNAIALYIPNVIVAIVILAAGLIIGQFLDNAIVNGIKSAGTPIKNPQLLGRLARWAIVLFAVFASLTQLSIADELIKILFTGIVLAIAIAFGLGGKEKAAKLLDQFDNSK